MINYTTLFLSERVFDACQQVSEVCEAYNEGCSVDVRYQLEWEIMRTYLESVAANLGLTLAELNSSVTTDEIKELELQNTLVYVLERVIPICNGLIEGHINDLSTCTEHGSCELRARAQQHLNDNGVNQ